MYLAPEKLKNIGIYLFSHTDFNNTIKDNTDVGLGFFFFKDNNPLDTVGGISIEVSDVFDAKESGDPLGDRLKINLLAKIKLPAINN